MTDTLTHKLSIVDTLGNTYDIQGGIGLSEIWRTWSQASFEATGKLIVTGITDCAKRLQVQYAIDHEVIKGMILVKL